MLHYAHQSVFGAEQVSFFVENSCLLGLETMLARVVKVIVKLQTREPKQ